MSTPLLSIGMIVKDEIRCLERCLKSLEGLRKAIPCEVVIADTGSTDGTREVAEKYADIVFDFEWCNDFSAARNAVLDRCSGKWHMQLDADEWLCDDYEELIHFCHSPGFKICDTASLRIQNYHSDKLEDSFTEFTAERLFRIDSGFRFIGKVHECAKPITGFFTPYKIMYLKKCFLGHDGYLPSVKQEKQKNKRNMDILLPLLEDNPKNFRLLCECIESTDSREEQRKYADRGLKLLEKEEGELTVFAPSLVRHALLVYGVLGEFGKLNEIWELAQKKFPNSVYIKLDGMAIMMLAYHTKKNYEKVNELGIEWGKNQLEYDNNLDMRLSQTLGPLVVKAADIYTILFDSLCQEEKWDEADKVLHRIKLSAVSGKLFDSFIAQFVMHVQHFISHIDNIKDVLIQNNSDIKSADVYEVMFKSLCGAEKWEDAQAVLHKIKIVELSSNNLTSFIHTFIDSDYYFSNPLQELQRVVIEPEEDFYKSDNPVSWAQYSRALRAKMEEHFKNGGALSPVIAQLETDIGYSARALREYDMQQMLLYAEKIENWENAMSQLYVRIMEQHLLFPAKFYQSNSEVWGNVASILSTLPDITTVFLSYAQSVPAITTEQLSWYSNIAAVLLAKGQWDTDEQAIQLCKCFAEIGHKLAETMYSPEMLTTENLHLLPSGYRFSWYLKQAMEAIQTNHLAECVPVLRAALKTAPVYNKVIHVLLDYVSSHNASPELLALAEKIRGILSQYSPDDPAVQAIKESTVYQKVAYLIDGVNPPAVGGLLQ